jgi:hypothetical protein
MIDANSRIKGDVVCELMFADSYNFLDSGDEGHPLLNEVDNLGTMTWLSMSIHYSIHVAHLSGSFQEFPF